MSFRLLRRCCGVGLALVCGLAAGHAQTESKATHGRALELSEPSTKETITNLNQLSGHNGLRELEDELSNSLKPFSPHSSLDGVLAPDYVPRPVPVARPRRLKEELEKRQNWMFLTPEDLLPDSEASDLLKSTDSGPDGKPKKKTPLEQFYERLDKQQRSGKNPLGVDPFTSGRRPHEDFDSDEESNLPGSIRDSTQKLKKMLNDEGNGSVLGASSGHGTFSDLFGLGEKPKTKDEIEQHKAYMDQYRKMLESSYGSMGNPADAFKAANSSLQSPYGIPNTVTGPTLHWNTDPTLGTLGTVINPGVLPDPNATVLNQWNPLYAPAKVDPPKPAPLTVPMPEAPRRRF